MEIDRTLTLVVRFRKAESLEKIYMNHLSGRKGLDSDGFQVVAIGEGDQMCTHDEKES